MLAQQYSGVPNLKFILQACRLKPIQYVKNKNNKLTLYRDWFDEFNSTLHINKKKQIKIVLNDLSLDVKYNACTDIYYGLSLPSIIKISKILYVQYGKCDESNKDLCCISCLGIDNYLRTFIYDDGWQQTSSLILGIDGLKLIAMSIDITNSASIIEPAVVMSLSKQWIIPANKEVVSKIFSNNQILNNLTKDI